MTDKVKLPVISSAASTAFCAARIAGPDGFLWIDGNQKITSSNGSYADPKPNAFSLEAQAVADREGADDDGAFPTHCPGSTSVCRKSCYVHGLEKAASETYELYRHNSKMIRWVLEDADRAIRWAQIMADWITANAAGGFRWHVSGDVFSREYASFIASVISRSPDVDHWLYTRSFHDHDMIAPLLDLDNLALNLSVDSENIDAAVWYMTKTRELNLATPMQLCYLTEDGKLPAKLPAGSVIFPDYALRGARTFKGEEGERAATAEEQRQTSAWWQGLTSDERKMVCPVDFYGKSERNRCGPCRRCLL